MPQPVPAADAEKTAREQAAQELALQFDQQAAEVREYLERFFGNQLRECMQALTTERPSNPTAVLSQVLQGEKSLGEVSRDPKTSNAALRAAAPRHYLNTTVVPALTPTLAQCFREQPARPVSHLGELLEKHQPH